LVCGSYRNNPACMNQCIDGFHGLLSCACAKGVCFWCLFVRFAGEFVRNYRRAVMTPSIPCDTARRYIDLMPVIYQLRAYAVDFMVVFIASCACWARLLREPFTAFAEAASTHSRPALLGGITRRET
jgi:hypothetical protein